MIWVLLWRNCFRDPGKKIHRTVLECGWHSDFEFDYDSAASRDFCWPSGMRSPLACCTFGNFGVLLLNILEFENFVEAVGIELAAAYRR